MREVNFETTCVGAPSCRALAETLFEAVRAPMYRQRAAVRPLDQMWADGSSTFARRVRAATRRGYSVKLCEPRDHEDDILDINRSMPERQGRRMDDSYWNRKPSTAAMSPIECPRHNLRFYGVFLPGGRMVAYASIARSGELVLVSQILGHGFFMKDGIMFLLMQRIMNDAYEDGPGILYYNVWDSGSDGLRWFKERLGFAPENLAWRRA